MNVDLVTYLLRQGCYGHDRGIVVLCAYLCVAPHFLTSRAPARR